MGISSLLNSHGLASTGSSSVAGQQLDDPSNGFASLFSALSPQNEDSLPETKDPISTNARLAVQQKLAASIQENPTGPRDLGSLQAEAEAALTNWQEQLVGKLKEKGIVLNEPLRLLVRPGDGKIVVQGDHPHKTEIEAALNEDEDLADSIRNVSSLFDLLRAAEGQKEFARAYEEDPVAAVNVFSHLFDEQTSWPVEFRVDDYGAELVS
jgi:hypothetical protein